MLAAKPGDVLAVWTGASDAQKAIRIGDLLKGKPAVANHVIGVTHKDKTGRWMGMEGRPGGFGLADCTPYLNDPRTRSNHAQYRELAEDQQLVAGAAELTGTPYDWVGIASETADALNLDDLKKFLDKFWRWPSDNNLLPGHIFCSNAWAYLYKRIGRPHPNLGDERGCSPGDWWEFNNNYEQVYI